VCHVSKWFTTSKGMGLNKEMLVQTPNILDSHHVSRWGTTMEKWRLTDRGNP
jgi:hypothetical protein